VLQLVSSKDQLSQQMKVEAHLADLGCCWCTEHKLELAGSRTIRKKGVHMLIHCTQEIVTLTVNKPRRDEGGSDLLLQTYGHKFVNPGHSFMRRF
jgi:hypothetical protein